MKNLTIVLYKNDLRMHDHPALYHGATNGLILPIYIRTKTENKSAQDFWIEETLQTLKEKYERLNQTFLILQGNKVEILSQLIQETSANQVNWNISFTETSKKEDEALKMHLKAMNVKVNEFNGQTLFNHQQIFNQMGHPYKVFTPFYNKCLQAELIEPLPIPKINPFRYQGKLLSEEIDHLDKKNWELKLRKYWQPGEDNAFNQITNFSDERLSHYKQGRDYPAQDVVSKLSPYLAVGSLSVRRLYFDLLFKESQNGINLEAFYRQLIWRDFSYYTLFHFPNFTKEPLRKNFNDFPWKNDSQELIAWKKGKTGYPFVDAAMRELWETGYMHNRARMVVGSFLVKHLLIDWRKGYDWFKYTLIDFDPANNAMGWQWVTGSGIDSSPYFRVFNPITQSEKFDKSAEYINQYVPEVKKIHQPFKLSQNKLESLNITLGKNYPYPLVDHKAARERALRAFDTIKNKAKSD